MRGYYVPIVAGLVLIGSTFLPWISLGDTSLRGMPSVPAEPKDEVLAPDSLQEVKS